MMWEMCGELLAQNVEVDLWVEVAEDMVQQKRGGSILVVVAPVRELAKAGFLVLLMPKFITC